MLEKIIEKPGTKRNWREGGYVRMTRWLSLRFSPLMKECCLTLQLQESASQVSASWQKKCMFLSVKIGEYVCLWTHNCSLTNDNWSVYITNSKDHTTVNIHGLDANYKLVTVERTYILRRILYAVFVYADVFVFGYVSAWFVCTCARVPTKLCSAVKMPPAGNTLWRDCIWPQRSIAFVPPSPNSSKLICSAMVDVRTERWLASRTHCQMLTGRMTVLESANAPAGFSLVFPVVTLRPL